MKSVSQIPADLQQQTVNDIKAAIAEAEDVLSTTADQAGEKMANLRARTQARLQAARVRLVQAEELLVARTKAAARATDAYVHESPWVAVGAAAGVGVLVGLLLGRR